MRGARYIHPAIPCPKPAVHPYAAAIRENVQCGFSSDGQSRGETRARDLRATSREQIHGTEGSCRRQGTDSPRPPGWPVRRRRRLDLHHLGPSTEPETGTRLRAPLGPSADPLPAAPSRRRRDTPVSQEMNRRVLTSMTKNTDRRRPSGHVLALLGPNGASEATLTPVGPLPGGSLPARPPGALR